MLKLRHIELQGFKSFYDRAEISVNGGGVTAIVGPNGCGKSNVSDAVAWVLGEQKARSLRGNSMQDVIFNGSGKRSALGMAEVTISLVDDAPVHSNGGPPPAPAELTVQRRLYRSGESQYLLNGRACRLRDIQEIFLGTGLGPNHYAIIEQGRIGQILSAKPTDRRVLIEEAAGITKFRARKKLAESKLDAARNNLSRVNDILSEIERQRNSLKRQAGKARRYREVRRRLREVLAAVFSTRSEILINGQERVANALTSIDAEGKALEVRISELDSQVHGSRAEVTAKDRQLEQARELDTSTRLELEKATQRIERLEDQTRALEERGSELAAERDHVNHDIERRQSEIVVAESKLDDLKKSLVQEQSELVASRSIQGELDESRVKEETAIEQLRNRRFDVIGKEAEISNGLTGKEELLRRLDSQIRGVRAEENEAQLALDGSRAALQVVELERSTKRSDIGKLALERDTVFEDLSGLKSELAEAETTASDARSLESATRHRLETIRELSLDRAYGTESVQQFFNHVRDEDWSPVGILADFVEVEQEYESVVEDLFHTELQYVVVASIDHAEKALGIVRNSSHGRLDLLLVDSQSLATVVPETIDGAIPVSRCVKLDARAKSFARYLDGAYVVDTFNIAWDLSNRYPGKVFVAQSGEVVHDCVISWGERKTHGPLSLKREMRELDRRSQETRMASKEAVERVTDMTRRVGEAEDLSVNLAMQLQENEKEALGLDHGVRSLVAELERAQQQVQGTETELARLVEERKGLETAMVQARHDLQEVRGQKGAIDKESEVRGAKSVRLRDQAEKQTSVVIEMKSHLAVMEERKDAIGRDLAGLEIDAGELTARRSRIEDQIDTTTLQQTTTGRSITEDTERREALTVKVAEIQTSIRDLLAELEALRKRLHQAEAAWDEARQSHDKWKDNYNKLQIERTEIDSDLKHLISLCRSELGENIESVCLDSFATLSDEELEAHDHEYRELREKLDSMGNVNMMAVEEYEDAVERLEFLSGQRQDLLDSIRDTGQAIDEIDAVCRKQFAEAYSEIDAKFREAFAQLFGGGQGELRLIEGADDSDAGIEIIAQPPGKKLQNVLLLSGGEKALTALALLIALFRFKPSPFCLLDEVDAPLDDANIERFVNLVRTMSDETQFIVITHSKRTMETASQLYGVTMEEAGLSKIVSVRLN